MRLYRAAFVVLFAACVMLAGCASSGPKFDEVRAAIPGIEAGKARIFFYRDASIVGAAMQPNIYLNSEIVGSSQPGGFFFVDRPPGKFEISVTTEVENTIEFTVAAGQTAYVRTSISLGVLVGRAQAQRVEPDQALREIADLHYTGDPARISGAKSNPATPDTVTSPGKPLQTPSSPQSGSAQQRPTGAVNMDDLKNLLPLENAK